MWHVSCLRLRGVLRLAEWVKRKAHSLCRSGLVPDLVMMKMYIGSICEGGRKNKKCGGGGGACLAF
jgi:hypothetical protein